MKNVLEYLERAEKQSGCKIAVDDGKRCLTYQELHNLSQRIGSAISKYVPLGKPIAIILEKSSLTLAGIFGVVYAGCFYVPIQPNQPVARINKILDLLKADFIITDSKMVPLLESIGYQGEILSLEKLMQEEIDWNILKKNRCQSKKTDCLYGISTSGSSGVPKVITVSHESVIRFIDHFTELFAISGEDRIGNQAPFDFDVSVKDIYSSIAVGATLVLIPKELFAIPPRLLDYLCEKEITVLIWAVSALCILSLMKGFDYRIPKQVKKVLFSGETMPVKQLRIWQKALPEALFVNLYGPTEITCNCTYYMIDKSFHEGDRIPIGRPFPGREIVLMDEDCQIITEAGVKGEICVTGESLSEGYYNNPEENKLKFPEYQIHSHQLRRIYKTGDVGYYGTDNEFYYCGRKDFQIKHMGHRIELEEIERALMSAAGVEKGCCTYEYETKRLLGFYIGTVEPAHLRKQLKQKLPTFMIPGKLKNVEEIPVTKNGKADRKKLLQQMKAGE